MGVHSDGDVGPTWKHSLSSYLRSLQEFDPPNYEREEQEAMTPLKDGFSHHAADFIETGLYNDLNGMVCDASSVAALFLVFRMDSS